MDVQTANNKRIAKNTLLLYIRMLFGLLVSLYTSRVILQTLGVEDYGVYNVVGGMISMFTFLNGAMSSAFAYISVLEIILKLLIVYLLLVLSFDKLKVYAILVLLVGLLIRYIYTRYCYKHFEESNYIHRLDKSLLMEMLSFASWSFWGNLAAVLYTQGLNMMLNIFFGPIVNAARGIATQVQGVIQQFVSNFQMALNPQITKTYAAGELQQMHSLMFRSARFSFMLLFFSFFTNNV